MRLRTFGGLELEGTSFKQGKPLLLVAYLCLEGAQDRRHLAELFWPGAVKPMANLATVLARLRKVDRAIIVADVSRVATSLACDATELSISLEQGALNVATDLYRGRFLEGFYLKGIGSELEEWVYATRERLGASVRQALLDLAEAHARVGEFSVGAVLAQRAYLLPGAPEPEAEQLERLYLLLRAGVHREALEVRKEAKAFDLELVLTAEEARGSLHAENEHELLETPTNLPTQPTQFVGRDAEKETLATQLERPDCRLVTLVGPGGIGKTRLAIEVARAQQGAFKDGVLFAPFAAVASPEHMIYTIADVLDVSLDGQADAREQLIAQLRDRELLLVLDNLEHLLDGAELIADVLKAAPGVKVLATSRERLDLLSEQLFEVPGLSFPHGDAQGGATEDLEAYDAVKLLVGRIQRLRPGFQPSGDNAGSVARICRLVGGMPLALELAASWLRVLTLEDVASEIEKGLDVLQTSARDMPERFRSIRAVFDHSWQLLSEPERAALRKLSVFRGGFRREAAAAVAGANLALLAHLVDCSFLTVDEGGRYGQHPLVHEYGQEQLAAVPEEHNKALDAHGEHYFAFIRDREQHRWGSNVPELLAEYDAELENLRAAWRWAVAGRRVADIRQSAEAFMWYFDIRTRLQDGIENYAHAVQGLDEDDPTHHAALSYVLTLQGHLLYRQGRLDEAVHQTEWGLALAEPLGDTESINVARFVLGTVAELMGDYPNAKRNHEEAIALSRVLGKPEIVIAMKNLAIVEQALGNFEQAKSLLHEALDLSRRHENPLGVIVILSHLGGLTLLTDGPREARALLKEGLELAHEIGFMHEIANLLRHLATAAYDLGAYDETRTLCLEALGVARDSSYRTAEALILITLGRVAAAQGDDGEAQDRYRQSLDIAWNNREIAKVLETLIYLAAIEADRGRPELATRWLSLARRHPATPQRFRVEAQHQLESMRHRIPDLEPEPEAVETNSSELRQVVEEILSTPPS